jgi:hypothetical protein
MLAKEEEFDRTSQTMRRDLVHEAVGAKKTAATTPKKKSTKK